MIIIKHLANLKKKEQTMREYINEEGARYLDLSIMLDMRYAILENFYCGHVPNDVDAKFLNNPAADLIFENLQSHDCKLLIKKLNERFPKQIGSIQKTSNDDLSTVIVYSDIAAELTNNDKFHKLLAFFNYFVTLSTDNAIYIEPVFTKTANQYIIEDCHRTVYHITKKEFVPQILKQGLKPRCGEPINYVYNGKLHSTNDSTSYRYFPNRIYVFAADDSLDINSFISRISDDPDVVVLKITVPDYVDFYVDSVMPEDGAFFTYNYIPSKFIKIVEK